MQECPSAAAGGGGDLLSGGAAVVGVAFQEPCRDLLLSLGGMVASGCLGQGGAAQRNFDGEG